MALARYKNKRNFKESPEPKGGKPNSKDHWFVVQKHKATNLHYDFRLEMEGVLKSWAVPKGPSTDPEIKRLAMMVEDHPYDYRNFEGIIPSGYGAGTVMVWDEGVYELADGDVDRDSKKVRDKDLLKGIDAGKLHIVLHGKKLKGEFALVKTKGRAENAWLLFKIKDKYASKEDITFKDKSIISKKTLTQLEKEATKKDGINNSKKTPARISTRSANRTKANNDNNVDKNGETLNGKFEIKGVRTKMPVNLLPMLATAIDKPFDKTGWQYEIKWDGYRMIAFCSGGEVEMNSRNGNSFNQQFYPVYNALKKWNINAIVDGEVVVLDKSGISQFGALQNWRSEADGDLYFYVFDLLWFDGMDLSQLPLFKRREYLKQILPEDSIIRFSDNFEVSGIDFFETIVKMGLEGIMAKKSDSAYLSGNRSKDWLKIKAAKRQEMVIGGYTKNADSSKLFSSLLLGLYEEGELIYKGKVGTGFTDTQQVDLLKLFKPLITKNVPFSKTPDTNKPSRFRNALPDSKAVWLKPSLVCEVTFTEMTSSGVMRHPSFKGMRSDKKAREVVSEITLSKYDVIPQNKLRSQEIIDPKANGSVKLLFSPEDEMVVKEVGGHKIKFTNLNKVYWPKEKIYKRDMLNYYNEVAPFILPYLKNRPQSMNRHPNGIDGKSFYFKDVTGTAPDWIETFDYKSNTDKRLRKYLVATDKASLLYMATLGCIEMNPWHSKVESEDYPDWCIIDLDPADNSFDQVIEAANIAKTILDSMGVPSYPKTSGSTGIHIYIPMGAKYSYEQSKEFARIIATLVHQEIPKYTSLERIVKARKGKMYIDFLQNRPQATVAAPYSLRPKPGATVSMPLYWEEVKIGLKMSDFTIYNTMERLKTFGDIFKPVLGKGINLKKVIEEYNS